MGMIYSEIPELPREEALGRLNGSVKGKKAEALISLAYFDPDWRWVQSLCIEMAYGEDQAIRQTAVLCLGHLARINRQIDLDVVLPVLYDLFKNPEVSGWAENALDDIQVFVGFNRKAEDRRRGITTITP